MGALQRREATTGAGAKGVLLGATVREVGLGISIGEIAIDTKCFGGIELQK